MSIRSRCHRKLGLPAQALSIFVVSIIAFFVFGCTTNVSQTPQATEVWLSDTRFIHVLPFDVLEKPLSLALSIQTSYQGKVYYMEALVRADSRETIVVGLDSLGTQMFEMTYDSRGLKVDTTLPFGGMKAEYLLADLQFAFFPWEPVRHNLLKAGFFPQLRIEEATQTRRILEGDRVLIDVKSTEELVILTHNLRQYSYKITVKEFL